MSTNKYLIPSQFIKTKFNSLSKIQFKTMIHILLTYLLSTNSKNTKSRNEKSQNLERDLYYMKIILDQILPGVYHPLPSYQTTNTTLNYIQVA